MDKIILHLEKEKIQGLKIGESDKTITVKLSNGYNIGVSKSRIKSIEVKKDSESELVINKSVHTSHKEHKKDLPKILILHTGGTIASKVDYSTGAVNAKFEPHELLELFPEISEISRIESRLFRNMMSDDMRLAHYNLIAKEISLALEKDHEISGIVITHGTDTMHYTSAALSFIFEHLPVPIVLVGSQRSSDRASSDSAVNIVCAVSFIANTSLKGVFVCMHESISDTSCVICNGLSVRKMHSSRRDAFSTINSTPIARVNFVNKEIEYLSEYPESVLNQEGKLKLHLFNENLKIGILVSHPQMFHEEIDNYKNFDGLIIEGTGLGHAPITEMDEFTKEHKKIFESIKLLCEKIPVVMSLQTIYGRVNMDVYSPGRKLQEIGVIGNHSTLTPETSFIKLSWLISQNLDPKEYFNKNLRSELENNPYE